jgi:hypothetical protein
MAAQEHLSGQLSMFIPARELMNYTSGHTEGFGDKYLPLSKSPGIYNQKLRESKEKSASGQYFVEKGKDSLHDSIRKEGIKSPVNLRIRKNDVQINDGHHRLVSAHDINPNMEIPVRYS